MKKLSWPRIISLFITASIFGASLSTVAAVTLYRGVGAKSNGNAALGPGSFKFNTELSTYDVVSGANACFFTFDAVASQVVGASGPVSGLPHGYIAVFDNNPPRHWSIYHPNNVTSAVAAGVVAGYAQVNRGNPGRLIDGSQTNPHCR